MLYLFDDYAMDVDAGVLRRGETPLPVTRKCFELLRHLAENPERVVDERELLRDVWQTPHLAPGTVRKAVSKLRRALGADHARIVHTERGDGYRIGVPVRRVDQGSPCDRGPFVGRGPIMARLLSALGRAQAGEASLWLLEGDTGLGKTRSLDELATVARRRGAAVWRAACASSSTRPPALWPWKQLLRSALSDEGDLPARAQQAARGWVETCDVDVLGADCTAAARFARMEELLTLLRGACVHRVRVVLIDDLDQADAESLQCLELVGQQLRDCQLLIVGTLRAQRNAALPEGLLRLARRATLQPFDASDVTSYLQQRGEGGCALPADALQRLSAGVPRRLERMLEELPTGPFGEGADARDAQLSDKLMRLWVDRADELPTAFVAALEAAALLDEAFDVDLVVRFGGLSVGAALAALDQALADGLLGCSNGRWTFADPLLARGLRARLSEQRRRELHLELADMLEARRDRAAFTITLAVAEHLHAALPLGAPERARSAAVQAARMAEQDRAPLRAAVCLEHALDALDHVDDAPPRARPGLLVARARVLLQGGEGARAMGVAQQALADARTFGAHDIVVDACRLLRYAHGFEGVPDEPVRTALEHVLVALPETDHARRSHALSTLARTPPHSMCANRSRSLSEQAFEHALRAHDPFVLAEAWMARIHVLGGPDQLEERLAAIDELLALDATETLSTAAHHGALFARAAQLKACMERSDGAGVQQTLASHGALAERMGSVEAQYAQRAYSVLFGPHQERAFGTAQRLYSDLEGEYPVGCVSLATAGWRIDAALRSEDDELALALHRQRIDRHPALAGHPLNALAWLHIHLAAGKHGPARALLAEYARHDFDDLPRDSEYLYLLCALVPAAVQLDDTRARARLKQLLKPHLRRHATSAGLVSFGPVYEAVAQC